MEISSEISKKFSIIPFLINRYPLNRALRVTNGECVTYAKQNFLKHIPQTRFTASILYGDFPQKLLHVTGLDNVLWIQAECKQTIQILCYIMRKDFSFHFAKHKSNRKMNIADHNEIIMFFILTNSIA
jgi:hypothetical protein